MKKNKLTREEIRIINIEKNNRIPKKSVKNNTLFSNLAQPKKYKITLSKKELKEWNKAHPMPSKGIGRADFYHRLELKKIKEWELLNPCPGKKDDLFTNQEKLANWEKSREEFIVTTRNKITAREKTLTVIGHYEHSGWIGNKPHYHKSCKVISIFKDKANQIENTTVQTNNCINKKFANILKNEASKNKNLEWIVLVDNKNKNRLYAFTHKYENGHLVRVA